MTEQGEEMSSMEEKKTANEEVKHVDGEEAEEMIWDRSTKILTLP